MIIVPIDRGIKVWVLCRVIDLLLADADDFNPHQTLDVPVITSNSDAQFGIFPSTYANLPSERREEWILDGCGLSAILVEMVSNEKCPYRDDRSDRDRQER